MSVLGSGTTSHAEHFYKAEIKVASLEDFQKILDSTTADFTDFVNDMSYLGFDKNKIAKMAAEKLGAFNTTKLCLLGGIRGTNLGKILDKSVKVDTEIKRLYTEGKILSNGSGAEDLTMGRLMATFPEITGFYMHKYDVPKKLIDQPCPAALQFPAAAGLPMNSTVRLQHLEFAVQFAFLISTDKMFHATYYRAAFNGQQSVKRLSAELIGVCGNPKDSESKAVDLDKMIELLVEKYGSERFVLNEGKAKGKSKK
jgi:hypothetical protein